jgi:integrase
MKRYHTNKGLKKRCGCARRTWETCVHSWFFTFQWKGHIERGSLGVASREAAVKALDEVKVAVRNGTYVRPSAKSEPAPAVDRPTFAVVAEQYVERHVRTKLAASAAENHDYLMDFLTGVTVPPSVPFTEKPFHLITIDDLEITLTAKRTPTAKTYSKGEKTWTRTVGGPTAARNLRNHLCGLWNWALAKGYIDTTPFNRGGRVPDELKKDAEPSRDRRLICDEEERLVQKAGEYSHLYDCIIAALETGMRKGEILSLQWKQVRWLQNEIALEWQNTKTRRARQIPISPKMREVLVRRQKAHPRDHEWKPEDYVFGNEIGERILDIKTAWWGACERAKIEDLHFHDLRHEAGSRKLEAGWPLHAVSRWLGHTKLTTTDTYLNATTQLLHELNERKPLMLVKS